MGKESIKSVKWGILLVITIFIFGFTLIDKRKEILNKPNENGFVILELFTSQGCSSCPPADIVLSKIAMQNNDNIIPLAFHVDYWNYIGWNDPFSKAEFTARQKKYATFLKSSTIYTPQVVINGKKELVGSREEEIRNTISKELALGVAKNVSIENIILQDGTLKVNCVLVSTNPNCVINVALVKKQETTFIKRGENKGLKQTNHNIVFDFTTKPVYSDKNIAVEFKVSPNLIKSDFKVVAYVQASESGVITSATQKEIN